LFTLLAQEAASNVDAGKAIALALGIGLGSLGAGIGIGNIFGNYLSGALRNPSAAPGQFTNLLIGFALAEATGLFGLLIALIILFG
jgi:F-type H+-transporting ATPase subunit c